MKRSASVFFSHPLAPALLAWGLFAFLGLVPPFSRDALNDHLVLPLLWGRHGWFWRSSDFPFSAFPPLADIPYVLFAGRPWDWAASLWHACGALLSLVLLERSMRNLHADASSSSIALLAWITAPVVAALCTWTYVDLWLCAAAAGVAVMLTEPRWDRHRGWIFGAVLGTAALVKYNGLALAVAALPALAWRWRRSPRLVRWMLQAAVGPVLVAAGWYVGNRLSFGQFLYPLGQGGVPWPIYRMGAYHESMPWALLAPLRQFFWGEVDRPRLFDGMLQPLWLLAAVACWRPRSSRISSLLLATAIYAAFALTTDVRARYWLPGMTLLLPLVAVALMHVRTRPARMAVAASFLPGLLSTGIYFAHLAPWDYWRHGRDFFLERHVPDYALMRWGERHLPEGAEVHLLWMGGRAYYLARTFRVASSNAVAPLRRMIASGPPYPQSYLMMQRKLTERTLGRELGGKWRTFLAHSRLLARQGDYELRRIGP